MPSRILELLDSSYSSKRFTCSCNADVTTWAKVASGASENMMVEDGKGHVMICHNFSAQRYW